MFRSVSMSSENRPQLPEVYKVAIWHNESGLIVSPFGRGLPLTTTARHDSTHPQDYHYPRCVMDDNIFLAFYPRRRIDYGFLFRVLAVSNNDLDAAIKQSSKSPPTFFLDFAIQEKWASLENLLLQVTKNLLEAHPNYRGMPDIDYPRLPHQYGYRHEHREKEVAYRCAKRARDAFTLLSALSSFAIALCLSRSPILAGVHRLRL
ncbi:hypothetical protein NLJ89_g10683 [Agrocybe chaxingu]|uniref:Uncharacterized protein n=1 Tax=Agrocybe chaxingu TaxID=84603 RepID=A0A9W8JQ98_9AGAR|nr:hypothetical protein NLJ89_g10683 [Agrocybe chaxingu]